MKIEIIGGPRDGEVIECQGRTTYVSLPITKVDPGSVHPSNYPPSIEPIDVVTLSVCYNPDRRIPYHIHYSHYVEGK